MKITPCDHKSVEELQQAPFLIHNTVIINCSADRLFTILEDAHAWTVWASSLTLVEWTSPKPFGIGTTRDVTMTGGILGREEFIAWETNQRMAFCFTESSMPNMSAFGEDYHIKTLNDNQIQLDWFVAMWPAGINKVFMPLFKPMMKWFLGGFLKKLKQMAEGDYQPH